MIATHLSSIPLPLPLPLRLTLRRLGIVPGRELLTISIAAQSMRLWQRCRTGGSGDTSVAPIRFTVREHYRISTSKFGVGQKRNSFQTPLGLHRIARKVGGGHPIGTVFEHRRALGFVWQGMPQATICHRILWLEGLEPGRNKGGEVDSFARYIYIHGFSDEATLGQPQSHGCIHLAAADLLPLFDRLPEGVLVWISER